MWIEECTQAKKQQICKPFPSVFLSFKGRLLTGFCQLFLLGPPESPLCMCNLVVIQGFGLSLCPYFGFTPYTTLSLPRFPGSYISSSFTSPELCPLLFWASKAVVFCFWNLGIGWGWKMGWGRKTFRQKDHKDQNSYPFQLKSFMVKFSSAFCLLLYTFQDLQIVGFCLYFVQIL